jgi:hypothetical protein
MAKTVPEMQNDIAATNEDVSMLEESVANIPAIGRKLYVNPSLGSDSLLGSSWSQAWKTMEHALSICDQFDVIIFAGTISEDSLTLATPNVKIVGGGFGANAAIWQQKDVDTVLLNITAANCALQNMRLRPPAYSASGHPVAFSLAGASHLQILDCIFQGRAAAHYAIFTNGTSDNVIIARNRFMYMNTAGAGAAIKGVPSGATIDSGWLVENNLFHSNLNHIVSPMRQALLRKNVFAAGGLNAAGAQVADLTVLGIDLHAATAGGNIVTENFLGSLYHQACYYGGTGDEWSGNHCKDRSHATQVDATTGISILAPAA